MGISYAKIAEAKIEIWEDHAKIISRRSRQIEIADRADLIQGKNLRDLPNHLLSI